MPKPKGHKPGCKCPFCKHVGKKGKKSAPRKTTKKAAGGGVMHKAYTYTNKKGSRVTVPAHVEHSRKR